MTTPRDWAADTVLFLVAVGFTALAVADDVDRQLGTVPVAAQAILGGLSCLGIWLRRRWPVGFACVVIVFSVYSIGASFVVLIALFTVAVHRRLAAVGLVTAGAALASIATALVRPDTVMPKWWQALLGIACVGAILAWGMFIRARRQLTQTLRERARQADEERITQARQQERHRIAREMHDVLAHRISLLSLHAGALELRPGAPADEVTRAAGVIRESAHRALEDLRAVIGVLRADSISDHWADETPEPPQPTLAHIPELVDESRQAGTPVRLDCTVSDPPAVPSAVGRTAYRIVQEGLTNARKHAHGAEVSVTISGGRGDGITLEILSRYPINAAATAIPGSGNGIIGLAERVGLAGGRLEHGRGETGDFRLWAWLPWP